MVHENPEERDRPDGDPGDLDAEVRVQRSEEQLETAVRLREAGAVRVRKSVHTDHEEFRVPKRREEVEIERVPADRLEAPEVPEGTELGEDEMVMQVYEEEVSVSKRLVLKEEIRVRKEVVEEEEVFETDLRREEVEVDDLTDRGAQQ